MNFGEYVKENRTKNNIKQNRAAKMLGVSTSYLSGIERGVRPAPSQDLIEKIADILELDRKESYRLYDLAAESKQPPTLSDDIIDYVYQNINIRDLLRYSMECQLAEKDWDIIFAFVKKNYHY